MRLTLRRKEKTDPVPTPIRSASIAGIARTESLTAQPPGFRQAETFGFMADKRCNTTRYGRPYLEPICLIKAV